MNASSIHDPKAAFRFTPQNLLNASDEALLIVAPDGRCTLANQACARLFGYSRPHELIGHEVHALIHHSRPNGAPCDDACCTLRKALQSGGETLLENELLRRADGSGFYADCKVRALGSGQGAPADTVLAVHPTVSQEHRDEMLAFLAKAAETLNETLDYEETLERIGRLAVPKLADWYRVDLVDDKGELQPAALTHRQPELIPKAYELRRRFPPLYSPQRGAYAVLHSGKPRLFRRITDDMLRDYARSEEHLELLCKLGLSSLMRLPLSARGRVFGVMTLVMSESNRVYDETDLVHAMELARRAALAVDNARLYHELQRAVQVREDVLAIVSHDLRSPLSSINMAATLLARTPSPERREHLLGNIHQACGRMSRLLDDLLDMASIRSGQLAIEPQPARIAEIVREVAQTLAPGASARQVALTSDIRVTEDIVIACDQGRIVQALQNLVGNAVKFSPAGAAVRLEAYIDQAQVVLEVADEGPGISEENLPYLFDPYWSGGRHRRLGTGLGLYITKGIVEAHGGRIEAANRPGAGSRFRVYLPLAAPSKGTPEP